MPFLEMGERKVRNQRHNGHLKKGSEFIFPEGGGGISGGFLQERKLLSAGDKFYILVYGSAVNTY